MWQFKVYGALVHGYEATLAISHADVAKGGSTTAEIIAHLLTKLARRGVNLRRAHVHLQLDNTAAANKNNTVLKLLAILAATGAVSVCTANFLRAGHTHEDICLGIKCVSTDL